MNRKGELSTILERNRDKIVSPLYSWPISNNFFFFETSIIDIQFTQICLKWMLLESAIKVHLVKEFHFNSLHVLSCFEPESTTVMWEKKCSCSQIIVHFPKLITSTLYKGHFLIIFVTTAHHIIRNLQNSQKNWPISRDFSRKQSNFEGFSWANS